ncbi:hypothetical protein SRB17_89460 [Streptomyces sp. RB17]|nr:hypothetical protein [Streptomyces sp. RB17]
MDPRGHMGADRPILGRQEPGAAVQLVTLGAGELKGSGESADDLGRGVLRTSLFQAQDVVDGEPRQLCELLAAQSRGTTADRHGEAGVGRGQAVAPRVQERGEVGAGGSHGFILATRHPMSLGTASPSDGDGTGRRLRDR